MRGIYEAVENDYRKFLNSMALMNNRITEKWYVIHHSISFTTKEDEQKNLLMLITINRENNITVNNSFILYIFLLLYRIFALYHMFDYHSVTTFEWIKWINLMDGIDRSNVVVGAVVAVHVLLCLSIIVVGIDVLFLFLWYGVRVDFAIANVVELWSLLSLQCIVFPAPEDVLSLWVAVIVVVILLLLPLEREDYTSVEML